MCGEYLGGLWPLSVEMRGRVHVEENAKHCHSERSEE
jgi:hypothetical protein